MTDIKKKIKFIFYFLVKRAFFSHFGFFKRAGRHEKGAGRRALQKKPMQNTDVCKSFFGLEASYNLKLIGPTCRNVAFLLLIQLCWGRGR